MSKTQIGLSWKPKQTNCNLAKSGFPQRLVYLENESGHGKVMEHENGHGKVMEFCY